MYSTFCTGESEVNKCMGLVVT